MLNFVSFDLVSSDGGGRAARKLQRLPERRSADSDRTAPTTPVPVPRTHF